MLVGARECATYTKVFGPNLYFLTFEFLMLVLVGLCARANLDVAGRISVLASARNPKRLWASNRPGDIGCLSPDPIRGAQLGSAPAPRPVALLDRNGVL